MGNTDPPSPRLCLQARLLLLDVPQWWQVVNDGTSPLRIIVAHLLINKFTQLGYQLGLQEW